MSSAAPSVHHLADLKQLYADAIATPEFQAAFGDPMPLSIIEPGDLPGEHDMPEPLAAQADCSGIIATLFDLFADTRLEPLAPEIAWGFVNSFHYAAGKLERREAALADELGDLARAPDLSEVLCEGSGLQANLYQLLRQGGIPIHAFRKEDQTADEGARLRPGVARRAA